MYQYSLNHNVLQSHKQAAALENDVTSLCSKIQQEVQNGTLSVKEASRLINKQGDVSS